MTHSLQCCRIPIAFDPSGTGISSVAAMALARIKDHAKNPRLETTRVMDQILLLESEADLLENSAANKRRRVEQLKTELEEEGKRTAAK